MIKNLWILPLAAIALVGCQGGSSTASGGSDKAEPKSKYVGIWDGTATMGTQTAKTSYTFKDDGTVTFEGENAGKKSSAKATYTGDEKTLTMKMTEVSGIPKEIEKQVKEQIAKQPPQKFTVTWKSDDEFSIMPENAAKGTEISIVLKRRK